MADGIYVRIFGDDSDLQNKLAKSAAALAKWGAAAAGAAAAATAAMVKSGLASADAQAKLAAQLNTTSEDLAIMARSADMAGVSQEKLAGASRALTNRLSQAAIGTGAAAASLDKLGLSAEYIQSLPLSERFSVINKALNENVAATERAAVAAALYGDEAALAVAKISPDTITTAADQVRALGGALSEIDAAKVEAANDAMSAIGIATDGLNKQLAAQFAPALEGAAVAITDMIEEFGGLGSVAGKVFDYTVKGAGFLANAWRGVQIVVDGLVLAYQGLKASALSVVLSLGEGIDAVVQGGVQAINGLIDLANNIPGVNMSKLVVGESEALATVRKWAVEANQAFIDAADNLHNRLMEPLPSESLDEWVGVVKERSEARAIAAAEAKEAEREQDQVWFDEDLERERERYATQLAELEAYEAAKSGAIKLWKADEIKTEQDMAAAKKAIDQASLKARLQVASSMMGNLSSLMDTENRKLFNIGKVAALAQATIDGYSAIQSSYAQGSKIGGPVVGAAFAATAAIATGVQIARIASTSYGSGGTGAPAAAASSNPNVNADQMVGGSGGGGQQERVFRLEGLSADSLYTGDQLMRLADNLVELQNDGYRLVPT